jgi:hypothetical protein
MNSLGFRRVGALVSLILLTKVSVWAQTNAPAEAEQLRE